MKIMCFLFILSQKGVFLIMFIETLERRKSCVYFTVLFFEYTDLEPDWITESMAPYFSNKVQDQFNQRKVQ